MTMGDILDEETGNSSSLSFSVEKLCLKDENEEDQTTCASSTVYSTQESGLSAKSVRFDTIEIRDYPLQLDGSGGVPSMGGVPLGISWNWIGDRTVPVDQFESERDVKTGETPRRPHAKLMALSSPKRTTILLEQGFKMRDIVSASTTCDKIRKKRASLDNETQGRKLWNIAKTKLNLKKITSRPTARD